MDIEPKTFGQPAKFYRSSEKLTTGRRNCNLRVYRNIWEIIFWQFVFPSLWEIERKNCNLSRKITEVGQSFILRVYRNNLMEKMIFEKTLNSFIFFRFWANIFWVVVDNFSAGGQNCFLHVRRKLLRKKYNFEKKTTKKNKFLLSLLDDERRILAFWQKVFRRVVKMHFLFPWNI